MIQANELRIGNYIKEGFIRAIYPHTQILTIEVSHYGSVRFVYLYLAEPIRLTFEIVEKCSFKEYPESSTLQIESEYGCEIEFYDGVAKLKDLDGGDVGKPILYLHQLQNLYFALTQTELIIKL